MNIEVLDVDGKEYYIVKKINNNGNLYYILVNTMDRNDLIIRKYLKEDNEEYIVGLDDEKEYYDVMKKYNNGEKNE